MTVTITSEGWIDTSYQISYSSDLTNPTFYVFVDGTRARVTTQTTVDLPIAADESPVVEIFDDPLTESSVDPCRVNICWYPVEAASYYKIERKIGEVWEAQDEIEENGQSAYTWLSPPLETGIEHFFRVVPIDSSGASLPEAFTAADMICTPDAPTVAYSYSSTTNTVTITETPGA
jgi:hypothetical protein